ncbi:chorismate-binding protein [Yinghuangia soli]|uniref:Chorismate-binding protein n=1 Tax=Yinghuangia soli TaxID=2908204 RepID=A0AA41U7Z5_9ACTN|nr:chorismate-binding protein [Yinghuangia soli]MCF2532409.1 chorismate-binding protein [Yinghuangia soli]
MATDSTAELTAPATRVPQQAPGQIELGRAQPYIRTRQPGGRDPLALVTRLARDGGFDESAVYERNGRWWFAGGAAAVLTVSERTVAIGTDGGTFGLPWTGSPAAQLHALTRMLPVADWRLYGWAAYDFALAAARIRTGRELPPVLARFTVPRVEVAADGHGLDIRALDAADLSRVLDTAARHDPVTRPAWPVDPEAGDPEAYRAAVRDTLHRIRDGELGRAHLSRRVPVPHDVDFPATYLRGRAAGGPARSFLLDTPGLRAAGFGPEAAVEVTADGCVTARWSARSFRRDLDPLGEFTVVAGSAPHDGRLSGRLSGRLHEGRTAWDALVALVPAATASGTPRSAAFQVIADHEDSPRGLYSGAVVRATSAGDLDAAPVLRAVYTQGGRTWLRAGACLAADSDPGRAYRETRAELAFVAPHVVPAVP